MIKIKCELCGENFIDAIAQVEGWTVNEWSLVGRCCANKVYYYIEFKRFNEMDWISHLSEKNWFEIKPFSETLFRLSKKLINLNLILLVG